MNDLNSSLENERFRKLRTISILVLLASFLLRSLFLIGDKRFSLTSRFLFEDGSHMPNFYLVCFAWICWHHAY